MKEVPRKEEEEVGGGTVYRPPPQTYPPMPGGPIDAPVPGLGDPATTVQARFGNAAIQAASTKP